MSLCLDRGKEISLKRIYKFRKEIANYPKSSKYLKELSKYYDSGTHVSGSSAAI